MEIHLENYLFNVEYHPLIQLDTGLNMLRLLLKMKQAELLLIKNLKSFKRIINCKRRIRNFKKSGNPTRKTLKQGNG